MPNQHLSTFRGPPTKSNLASVIAMPHAVSITSTSRSSRWMLLTSVLLRHCDLRLLINMSSVSSSPAPNDLTALRYRESSPPSLAQSAMPLDSSSLLNGRGSWILSVESGRTDVCTVVRGLEKTNERLRATLSYCDLSFLFKKAAIHV